MTIGVRVRRGRDGTKGYLLINRAAVERRQGIEVRAGEDIFQKLGHLRFLRQRPDGTSQTVAANELLDGFDTCGQREEIACSTCSHFLHN